MLKQLLVGKLKGDKRIRAGKEERVGIGMFAEALLNSAPHCHGGWLIVEP